ncbi:MAG: alpha-L-fucosidase, partial [Flavisolibacter sp.]
GEQQNYLTPEQQIPENGLPYPWETCMTMATSWSYVPNDTYKPADEIIKKLVDIVSKGGNYLLNIGPGPDGELDPTAYQRLKEIGSWMKINSEAIYGSRMYTVFGEGDNIRFTQSKDGKTQYIFLYSIPKDKLILSKMQVPKNTNIQMLGSSKKLKWKTEGDKVEISVPASLQDVSKYVWVLKLHHK